ncbi:MAG: LuxR C-terminal-related transcriptional regulator [Burkholderiales bacterium]|nr:LuxR C-terminal-related transcriptional regulator [Burkholderiales bacterium]
MAAPSFALTKIQAPRPRASLVARELLEQRMADAAMAKRLVLLAAPAGFGKTAALTRLISRLGSGAAVAWVAVDSDDDPLGLLACLCAALEPFDPPWRTDPEALVAMAGGSRGDRHAVISELLNTLAACEVERGLIVVDDAHRIRDPAVFEFLDHLLERLPPQWGVVLSTRTEPPLALARLRAHDELAEFRERDLRFGLAEVRALLPELPAHVDPASTSRRLLERTQGWAVGLRLAVNSLAASPAEAGVDRRQAGVADSSADRHVFDYLLAEVLGAMPPDLRAFLLRCSVLSELSSARCAAVSADARAAHWLDEVERRGLFVSVLEGPEPTLRLHDLFRDFLQDRLRREMPDELPALYRRAAAGEPDMLRRTGFLIRSGDWTEAEAELAEAGGRIVTTVGPAPVLRLLEQFPPPLHERSGRLAHIRCLCAWARWDWPAMREAAERARRAYESAGDRLGAWRSGLYAAISSASFGFNEEARQRVEQPPPEPLGVDDRAFLAMTRTYATFDSGRLDILGQRYGEVLDALESSANIPLWYHCVPRSMQCGLPGMNPPLARFANGALRVLPDMPSPLRALALSLRAWGELSAGDIGAATATAQLAESDARWLGPPPNVRVFVYALLSILHAMHGRPVEARQALEELMKTFDDPDVGYRPGSFVHIYYCLHRVRIADLLGDVEAARGFFAAVPADPRPLNETMRRVLATHRMACAGRLAAHEGRTEAAIAAFGSALADDDAFSVYGQSVEVRLRLALALLDLGRIAEAAAAVEQALAATARQGEPGGALMLGATRLLALADRDWQGRLAVGAAATLRAWAALLPQGAPATARPAGTAGYGSAAPVAAAAAALSPRELEVLRHIAAGDSNKLIARAFDLSPHTVKRHVANILDKLMLQSRGQAAAWYRQHGVA